LKSLVMVVLIKHQNFVELLYSRKRICWV